MTDAFHAGLQRLAAMDAADLGAPWVWTGNPGPRLTRRDACYQALERELAQVSAPASAAQRALVAAQVAARDLCGLLVGLPDAALDESVEDGWSVRRILTHVVHIERRYRIQTRIALGWEAPGVEPPAEPAAEDGEGGISTFVDRILACRGDARAFSSLGEAQLQMPTTWVGHRVDVAFRLIRAAAHLHEHAVHLETTLARTGHFPDEARLIARLISRARGAHELMSPPTLLAELDRRLP